MPDHVVITGFGAVTPVGNDGKTTWTHLLDGRSGDGPEVGEAEQLQRL